MLYLPPIRHTYLQWAVGGLTTPASCEQRARVNIMNQLHGVPKLTSSTGEAQGPIAACLIEIWGLVDRIASMCFDTTSSNTGNRNVACVLLEQKLGKKLLHLAFRHHLMELVPACRLPRQFALTSGPDVATCKRFQINLTNIDQIWTWSSSWRRNKSAERWQGQPVGIFWKPASLLSAQRWFFSWSHTSCQMDIKGNELFKDVDVSRPI